ncbi:hypothetical protein [Maribacter sp. ACAM166]|uniref:hypothetical protein n=1 Tax=Maribacter sp. ACAM166 TaxID=2508996 RepID=UPI001BB16103|nr:hypothetical protein [Maribacter sp. ACAM166]
MLKLTELGIANSYLNPPCEIESLASGLQKELSINDEFPTIIMRIGYAEVQPFAPRKAVEEVIF